MAETGDQEFDDLVARMHDPLSAERIEVIEVAETASMVEFTVPIKAFPHPEVALLEAVTDYLRKTERRAVIVMNCTYELRNGDVPFLIATLLLTQPV